MGLLSDACSTATARTMLEAHHPQVGCDGLRVELPARTSHQKVPPRSSATQPYGYPLIWTENTESPMWIDASQLKTLSSTKGMATQDLPWLCGTSLANTSLSGDAHPLSYLQPAQTTSEGGLVQELADQVNHVTGKAKEAQTPLMAHRKKKNNTKFHAGVAASTQVFGQSAERSGSATVPWEKLSTYTYECLKDQYQGMMPQAGFQCSDDQFVKNATDQTCIQYSCPVKPFYDTAVHDSIGNTEPISPGLLEMSAGVPDPPNVGSLGHPLSCAVACKYAHKARGCKDGANCTRCHLCPWRRKCARTDVAKDE